MNARRVKTNVEHSDYERKPYGALPKNQRLYPNIRQEHEYQIDIGTNNQ